MSARTKYPTRRSLSAAVLLFMVVFLAVWTALTVWTGMYGDAKCLVSALAAGWAAHRFRRPFTERGRR
ncbi:hypothetical protein [Actinomadura terrae]|uniref:hypothetical protein n=1 Tax=Actinomadura terrae TaxID=604353 RepID=UPI001FA7E527|nr:hypothetical protein [Actinomadura terrae]